MINVFKALLQQRTEKQRISEEEIIKLRSEAILAYTDCIIDIFHLKSLPDNNHINVHNSQLDIARAKTVAILRRLENDVYGQARVIEFLRDTSLIGFILSGANLRNINLESANLEDANFSTADLERTDLENANLKNANLNDANLKDAYLRGANLTNVNLAGADLKEATLTSANLSNADLTGADLKDTDLSGANLRGAKLNGTDLSNANLSSGYDGSYPSIYLNGANFSNADLNGANLKDADIKGADFTNVRNFTVELLKATKNWETAIYNLELRSLLGLPPKAS